MKKLVLVGIGLLFLAGVATQPSAKPSAYVEVKRPFANVYEFLDPKSTILRQARKGEFFPLVYEGTSWYQVKVKEQVGWLEKRAGDIVDSPRFLFYSIPFATFSLFIILLIATLTGVSFFIYRQKNAEL